MATGAGCISGYGHVYGRRYEHERERERDREHENEWHSENRVQGEHEPVSASSNIPLKEASSTAQNPTTSAREDPRPPSAYPRPNYPSGVVYSAWPEDNGGRTLPLDQAEKAVPKEVPREDRGKDLGAQ